MRFSVALLGLAAALSATETRGFVPRSAITSSFRPITGRVASESLCVVSKADDRSSRDGERNDVEQQQPLQLTSTSASTKTAAMTLFLASVLAVSTGATSLVVPVEGAWAATSSTVTTTTAKETTKAAAPTKAPTKAPTPAPAAAPSLSKEEKERLTAKKNLDLTQQTLKEYQKYVGDTKQANQKASSELATATKNAESAKKQYVAAADKLSAAKSQKMPSSAIQELSKDAAKLKEVLKEKERILGEATKKAAQTAKDFKSAQSGVDSSQDALKKAKTRAEKAEKAYQNWAKKVQEQKKKEAQELKKQQEKYAAELKKQEQKVKELQKSTEQLKKAKEQETKELANKKKALENELKNLEKLKSVKK